MRVVVQVVQRVVRVVVVVAEQHVGRVVAHQRFFTLLGEVEVGVGEVC